MSIKVVVVDMAQSLTRDVCGLVSKVCLQELSLYLEQARQTAFMLACLATHTEILFPLTVVGEESLQRARSSVETLLQFHQDSPLTDSCNEHTLTQCLKFVLDSGNSLLSNKCNGIRGSVDILFVTSQSQLKNSVDSLLSSLNCSIAKKVTVMTVADNSGMSSPPECLTEIEDVSVTPHTDTIRKCMRKWFFGRDADLLTLLLPNDVVVSCDLCQLMVDVSSFKTDTQTALTLTPPVVESPRNDKVNGQSVALKALQLFDSDMICESVLFGCPMLLLPSTHWTIEWEELEKNQHKFAALCKSLTDSNKFLLCQNTGAIHSYFLILTEPGGSALIKSVVSMEFLLPRPNVPIIQPSSEASDLIANSLEKLDVGSEQYSPLDFLSDIYSFLSLKMSPKKKRLLNHKDNDLYEVQENSGYRSFQSNSKIIGFR